MKVIDLLNKIANEDIPKRIIYDEYVYELNESTKGTKNYEREIDPLVTINWDYVVMNCLNEEVEIIEEEKKIPKKIEEYIHTDSLNYNQCNYMFEKLTNKYNELIDYLDYLKSKGDE